MIEITKELCDEIIRLLEYVEMEFTSYDGKILSPWDKASVIRLELLERADK